jgi:hypothetical protein
MRSDRRNHGLGVTLETIAGVITQSVRRMTLMQVPKSANAKGVKSIHEVGKDVGKDDCKDDFGQV